MTVTVAIPVRNGSETLSRTLEAVQAQRLECELELIVCDSGSRDASVDVARSFGSEVVEIPSESFSHGGTRNLLMERSHGEHVAFLTQDAVPADDRWLARLLGGFALTDDVALAFGPYEPRPDASPMVARELTEWFRSFSPSGQPRIDRLELDERKISTQALLGRRGFFTDANGCVSRVAWESVPFRQVAYAEDHLLAHDMLRAGYAKAYVPGAAVIHSHDYSGWGWLRRSFDEARAMNDVYGFSEKSGPSRAALMVWGQVGADLRWSRLNSDSNPRSQSTVLLLASSLRHHALRAIGTMLGVRAGGLPGTLVQLLSLERRRR